jgi:xanthine dehydrogenase accessory factor
LVTTGDTEANLFEPLERPHLSLWLYGAGHVGQALVNILADLPFDVTWVDSRQVLLPGTTPDNVHSLCSQSPVDTVDSAPAGALFLVMTHDHSLDYQLCRKVLERGDFHWLGLIGSKSKGARFRSRFARDGLTREQIARLTCPIGVDGVTSKIPAAIAVAVAAQLLTGIDAAVDNGVTPMPDDTAAAGVRAAALDSATEATASGVAVRVAGCGNTDCDTCATRSTRSPPAKRRPTP